MEKKRRGRGAKRDNESVARPQIAGENGLEADEEREVRSPLDLDQEDRKWNRVPDSYRREVGARIRYYREAAGYTVTGLGTLLGKKEQTISSWETGRSLPKYPELIDLARALRVDLWILLTGERPQRWEAIMSLLPVTYRKAVLAIRDRKELRQLVDLLADLDPKDVAMLDAFLRRFRSSRV